VLVLEKRDHIGGAAVSERPWEGVDARLSRYSYLVSLLPHAIVEELGLPIELRRRTVSSYTPRPDGSGLLVSAQRGPHRAWDDFYAMTSRVGQASSCARGSARTMRGRR
jgi:phytoene dehydrogenase-like protein